MYQQMTSASEQAAATQPTLLVAKSGLNMLWQSSRVWNNSLPGLLLKPPPAAETAHSLLNAMRMKALA